MAVHEAQAYMEPGTPEEQTRREFLANATIAVRGIIGLVLTVPLVGSLIPESLLSAEKLAHGVWANLPKNDIGALRAKPGEPVKISFDFKHADGYLPPASDPQSVWGLRLTPEQEKNFKEKRPDLYESSSGAIIYDAIALSFVYVQPHLPASGLPLRMGERTKTFLLPL